MDACSRWPWCFSNNKKVLASLPSIPLRIERSDNHSTVAIYRSLPLRSVVARYSVCLFVLSENCEHKKPNILIVYTRYSTMKQSNQFRIIVSSFAYTIHLDAKYNCAVLFWFSLFLMHHQKRICLVLYPIDAVVLWFITPKRTHWSKVFPQMDGWRSSAWMVFVSLARFVSRVWLNSSRYGSMAMRLRCDNLIGKHITFDGSKTLVWFVDWTNNVNIWVGSFEWIFTDKNQCDKK